jgi:pheromone alpha factor receptor
LQGKTIALLTNLLDGLLIVNEDREVKIQEKMSASHTNDTKPFDPTLQTFTLMTSDGSNRTLTIDDLNSWYLYNIKLTISMGCQFGALFVMFLVTLIMTSPLKRRTPVFILNMLSLGLGASFSLFYMISETTRYFRFYEWFTYDISFVTPGDEAISVLGTLMSAFMLVTINMSLVLNAHTVCKTMDRKYYYYGIIAVSIILLVLSGCFRIAQCILNILSIMGESDWIFQRNNYWLQKTALMSESGSIWWFCIIFSAKLIHSQYQRRKMRMCGWPYIQVLTSMAGATMIIPCKHLPNSYSMIVID